MTEREYRGASTVNMVQVHFTLPRWEQEAIQDLLKQVDLE